MRTILHIELDAYDKVQVHSNGTVRVFTGDDFEIHMQHNHARFLYHKLGDLFADSSKNDGQPAAGNFTSANGHGAVVLNIAGAHGPFQEARNLLRRNGGSFDRDRKQWSIPSDCWSRVKDSVYATGVNVELF